MKVGAIVLAAGESARMGQPKQLLSVRGTTMLERAIRSAGNVASPVVVVLGHEADRITSVIFSANSPGQIAVVNQNWREGIASSIRAGIEKLLDSDPATEGVLIVLSDQPLVEDTDLEQLVTKFAKGSRPVVASSFAGTVGPPAIFARSIFGELLGLRGEHGAKRIITSDLSRVLSIPLPRAAMDVDTPEQYQEVLPEVESPTPSRQNR